MASDVIEWPGPGEKADDLVREHALNGHYPEDAVKEMEFTSRAHHSEALVRDLWEDGWSCLKEYDASSGTFAAVLHKLDPGEEPRTDPERHRAESKERMADAVAKAGLKARGFRVVDDVD